MKRTYEKKCNIYRLEKKKSFKINGEAKAQISVEEKLIDNQDKYKIFNIPSKPSLVTIMLLNHPYTYVGSNIFIFVITFLFSHLLLFLFFSALFFHQFTK